MIASNFELGQGQMVGEYRVERKIGEGAFGKVYAAIHPVIGKPAAIKVLNPTLSANQEMVTRFVAEARAVNQIRHRNIIDIFSFGTLPNGVSYFVMELLEGMTFQQYLRQNGPLDPAVAFSILWPVGKALAAAHKAGIAHRDLKPENVFLVIDQEGGMFPKLLDFGIAKLMSESEMAHRTQTGMLLGTPVYMSPEQCRATQVDHRSDIYAFGIMTHEALSGRRPFDAENVMDVIMKQLTEPAPRLSVCRPGLPPALDVPVLHMLEKQAANRPQSIQAALDELAEAARTCGIQSPVSLPQGSGGAPVSMPATTPGAPPTRPQAASSPSLDTGAWLQENSARGSSMAGPAGSMAGPAGSMAGPAGSMAGPPGSMAVPAMSGAVPSLILGPPSGAGPGSHSPSASYAGPGTQPAPGPYSAVGMPQGSYPTAGMVQGGPGGGFGQPGDAATLMSAGVQRASSPSIPGSGPATSMSGFAPMSTAQPAPPKSKLPLFVGGGAVVLLLLVGGGLALTAGGKGDSGAPLGGSSAGVAGTGASVAPNGAVQIGAAPPRVGRTFDHETDVTFQLEVWLAAAKKPLTSTLERQHRKFKVNVLAVNEWHATRLEVQYAESFETTQQAPAPEKKKVGPTANRGFFVASQDSGSSVSPVDGKPITDAEKDAVKSDVSDFLRPRAEVFRRPLVVGDSLSPPASVAGDLLGITNDDDGTETRAENAVLKLTAIDQAQSRAVFDVQFSFVYSVKASKMTFTAPMKGSMSFDIPTGIAVAGKLTGPVDGSFTESGVKGLLKGNISMEVKANVAP